MVATPKESLLPSLNGPCAELISNGADEVAGLEEAEANIILIPKILARSLDVLRWPLSVMCADRNSYRWGCGRCDSHFTNEGPLHTTVSKDANPHIAPLCHALGVWGLSANNIGMLTRRMR